MASSMEMLAIKTENKFRSLVTKRAYKKGDVICDIPTEKIVNKPNRFTVQIDRDKHTDVGKLGTKHLSENGLHSHQMTCFLILDG